MRKIHNEDNVKRGCRYCADSVKLEGKIRKCPHEECPYSELDGYESYKEYLKNTAGDPVMDFIEAMKSL